LQKKHPRLFIGGFCVAKPGDGVVPFPDAEETCDTGQWRPSPPSDEGLDLQLDPALRPLPHQKASCARFTMLVALVPLAVTDRARHAPPSSSQIEVVE
jgi:hypothetical protein